MERDFFLKGNFLDLLFKKEGTEYKMEILSYNEDDMTLIVKLDDKIAKTFYKGEDDVSLRYVKGNFLYDFEGEILKINKKDEPSVFIKISDNYTENTFERKARYSVDLPAEYIISDTQGEVYLRKKRGFGLIKDINLEGLSFVSSAVIPLFSTLVLFFDGRDSIVLEGEVKKTQIVNGQFMYGIKINKFLEDGLENYKILINDISDIEKKDNLY